MLAPNSRAAALGQEREEVYLSQVRERGVLEYDGRTEFSRMRIYRSGSVRCMAIVYEDEREAFQSCVDFADPGRLQFAYLAQMSHCNRYAEPVRRALLVGLGGGCLVHYYRRAMPWVRLDVVEIDGGVIELARDFFGVSPSPGVRIEQACACARVRESSETYDVAMVDPFLEPSAATTASGHAACVQRPDFLAALRRRLRPGGAAAFNCHDGEDDVALIRRGFARSVVLPAPGASVVIGLTDPW